LTARLTGPYCLALLASAAVAGCASTGNPKDPLEGFNRAMFAFNEAADKAVFKPIATGYDNVLPLPGRAWVGNFFSNLADPWIGVNNLAQGKLRAGFSDLGRFVVNTTVGIAGTFDVASEMGLEKHEEDFGQTLGRWGVGEGAYVVWPIIGPRTVRDTVGFGVDFFGADPVWDAVDISVRNSATALRFIDTRAQLLPATRSIDEAALDKYSYTRDAYLQRRRSLVHDGSPPRDKDEDARGGAVPSAAAGRDREAGDVRLSPSAGAVPGTEGWINVSGTAGVDASSAGADAVSAAGKH
jgi:phospholipid-binding lipoprotein MlaA